MKRLAGKVRGQDGDGPTEAVVRSALEVVNDPDLHKDIVTLGFVRNVVIEGGEVSFDVNLTTPACPAKEDLKRQAQEAVAALKGVRAVAVNMTATTRGRDVAGGTDLAALAGVRNLVAVASGKGGVGKSTTSVNLAYALAATGARVALVDADVMGPSIPRMTGVGSPGPQQGGLIEPPVKDGIAMVSMGMFVAGGKATIMRGPRLAAVLKQFLTGFSWGEIDYMIVDCPPGTGDIPLTLAQSMPLGGVVLVTTPQEVALIDVRKAASMFATLEVPVLGVVETMSWFTCDQCDARHAIFPEGGGPRVAQELGVPLLAQIPLDPAVAAGGDAGAPIVVAHPESTSARAFREAAGALAAAIAVRNS